MTRALWMFLAAFGLAAVLFCARLSRLPLIDPDEGRNASVALEMVRANEWLVPTLDGVAYLDKPALFFRLVAASFALFGPGEAAARLPSVIAAFTLLGLLAAFCRREYGNRAAALAVVVAAGSPLVIGFARTVIFDMPLALCTTAAIFSGFRAEQLQGRARSGWHLAAAALCALGTLLKGPVGFLVPGLVLLIHFWSERRRGVYRRLLAPANFAVFFALTLPWFLAVQARQPDFARYGLLEESLRRFGTGAFQRPGPIWYYLPVILAAFCPWSAFLPQGAMLAWRRRRSGRRLHPADRLFLVWAVTVVIFFSLSRSKLPGYVLSAVVAASALVARFLDAGWNGAAGEARERLRRAAWLLSAAAAVISAFLITAALLPGGLEGLLNIRSAEWDRARPIFLPAGLTLAAVAVVACAGALLRRAGWILAACLLFPLGLLTSCFGGILRYAEASSSRGLAAAVPPGASVLCLECFPPGLPYYLERPVMLMTDDGRELTSNYLLYKLGRGAPWPPVLLRRGELAERVERRDGPLFLLAKRRARAVLDSLAAAHGTEARLIRAAWRGALLPAPGEN